MIEFKDSEGGLISEAGDGTIINFHNRTFINPGLGVPLEEGTDLIIFTRENFDKLQQNYDKNMEDLKKLTEECIEIAKTGSYTFKSRINSLEKENENLKRLNTELSKTISKLKEGG